ncbi:MAG: chloride channel protein, partial [Myxococcales bacterium]|nr:chloride channel protein [Myxococcales bacterium]
MSSEEPFADVDRSSGRLPVAPSLGPTLRGLHLPPEPVTVDRRVIAISAISIVIGISASLVARILTGLIAFVTNLSFYGRLSAEPLGPAENHLGWWVVPIPVVGGLIVGVMARYGSSAIRGHGIPEAMERVLFNESRIPPRITFLKPLSAAVAIGTGGPFGAEGPII